MHLKVAATARDAPGRGRLMIGHIFLFPVPERYTAERSVDLSGVKRNSLPSEGLFNHVCRLRRWKSMAERKRRGQGWRRWEKSYTAANDK